MTISKRVVLHFPSRMVDQPIIHRLVRDYDLVLNTKALELDATAHIVLEAFRRKFER